jgi:hypothetical protein
VSAPPSRFGEWLLQQLGASEALVGDLCEAARHRGPRWYWTEVAAYAAFSGGAALVRHPVRTVWILAMTGMFGIALAYAADVRRQPRSDHALRIELVATGWRVADEPGHRVRVVPAARLRIVNQSQAPVTGVQVNAVFRRAVDGIEWGNHWRPVSRGTRLAPGAHSEAVLVTSDTGHLSAAPAAATFRHPSFVDATVQIYGRYGAQSWAKLADYRVPRQLVEP